MDVAAYQDAFAAALLADGAVASPSPMVERLRRQPGFAVYRNTVMKGCIDALQANFPTAERLVGRSGCARPLPCLRTGSCRPQPSLLVYGEEFPSFLAAFEPAREFPYLADVARVDRLWTEAHVAADAPVLDAATLAALPPSAMALFGLRPHPAARWMWSDDWPIHTLWSRNRWTTRIPARRWSGSGRASSSRGRSVRFAWRRSRAVVWPCSMPVRPACPSRAQCSARSLRSPTSTSRPWFNSSCGPAR